MTNENKELLIAILESQLKIEEARLNVGKDLCNDTGDYTDKTTDYAIHEIKRQLKELKGE